MARRQSAAAEARAVASDEAAQERAAGDARGPRIAQGFVHAKHPDHGETVTFLPGEQVPEWAPTVCKCARCSDG